MAHGRFGVRGSCWGLPYSVQLWKSASRSEKGRRCVTEILNRRSAHTASRLRCGPLDSSRRQACEGYHRELSRVHWSARKAAQRLLIQLVERFVPESPVVIGVTDTVERRREKKISARGIYRGPTCSSEGHLVNAGAYGKRCKDARWARSETVTKTRCARSSRATLECELIERGSCAKRSETRLSPESLRDTSQGGNPHRLHSGLDYQSPMSYEEEYYSQKHSAPAQNSIPHRGRKPDCPQKRVSFIYRLKSVGTGQKRVTFAGRGNVTSA